jgi:hypothetical protein
MLQRAMIARLHEFECESFFACVSNLGYISRGFFIYRNRRIGFVKSLDSEYKKEGVPVEPQRSWQSGSGHKEIVVQNTKQKR